MNTTIKKFVIKNKYNYQTMGIWVAAFAMIGISALLLTKAATPNDAGIDNSCVFNTADKPLQQAFCDAFNAPNNGGTQTGDLDPVLWGVSRFSDHNPSGLLNSFTPSHNFCLGGGTTGDPIVGDPNSVVFGTATPVPQDVKICNGQVVESLNDGGGVASIHLYPKQPFNFAGRTGTVVFDVSNDSGGTHAAWPEFVITDKPVPGIRREISLQMPPSAKNSIGFMMAGDERGACPDKKGVSNIFMTSNGVYSEPSIEYFDNCITAGTKPSPSSPGIMNHFEVRVSQTRIDIYGTDAGTNNLQHMVGANINLTFSQGLVWMNDVHYNARKGIEVPCGSGQCSYGTQYDHSFAWDNLGFDGPKTYRDLGYDVPYANENVGNSDSHGDKPTYNLGYKPGPTGRTWTLPGVVKPSTPPTSTPLAAQVVMNDYSFDENHPSVSINGNPFHTIPWQPIIGTDQYTGDNTYDGRAISIPIPINEVINGDNTIKITASDSTIVSNVSLIVVAGAAVPGQTVNPNPDTSAPIVSISSPTPNATISSTAMTVTANASDNIGVTKVEFFIDRAVIASSTSLPYTATLNTTSYTNGTHILSAKAYDSAGNIGSSADVSFTVNNTNPTPRRADFNNDGVVNSSDLFILLGHFGTNVPANTMGDTDGNGLVNSGDLFNLLGLFGK